MVLGPCSLVCEVGAAGFLSGLLCTQPGPAPARVLIGLQWIEHCGLFVASRPSRCGPGCLCLCGRCVPWGLLEGMSLSTVLPLSRAVTCCPSVHPWGRGRVWRGWNPGSVVAIGTPGSPACSSCPDKGWTQVASRLLCAGSRPFMPWAPGASLPSSLPVL